MTSTEQQGSKPGFVRNIIILLLLGTAMIVGLRMAYLSYTAIDYRALNDGAWNTVQVGIPFIQFESPVPLEDKSRPPLGPERDYLKRNQSFVYEQGFDLRVIVTIADYHPHVFIDPGSLIQAVKNFDKQFGASDITYEPMELIIGTYKAQRIDGSFTVEGKKYVFSRVNVEYRNNFRDLLVIVRADDQEALLVKNRMVGTVFFEPL